MTAIHSRPSHIDPVTEGFEDAAWTPVARTLRGLRIIADDGAWRLEEALTKLAEAEETITRLQERIADLESLSMTDELTGLLNRRGFHSHFHREMAAVRRNGSGGVLVMIDLDGFKAINDSHGHVAGDAYLRQVARFLTSQVRPQDVVARLGGDEFAILLTATDAETGASRARQLAAAAEAQPLPWNGEALPLRFSVGMQAFGPTDQEDEVLRQADVKMYGHKNERRRARRAA